MKVAIISESPKDEAIVSTLVKNVLDRSIEVLPRLARTGGVTGALAVIAPTLKHLHYRREAELLICVVDSDRFPPHQSQCAHSECLHCKIEYEFQREQSLLSNLPAFPTRISVIVAVPPPSIEAWLLTHRLKNCNEAHWVNKLAASAEAVDAASEIRRLKQVLYGNERPTDQQIHAAADEAAHHLPHLEQEFPNSFGLLASALRAQFGKQPPQKARQGMPPLGGFPWQLLLYLCCADPYSCFSTT